MILKEDMVGENIRMITQELKKTVTTTIVTRINNQPIVIISQEDDMTMEMNSKEADFLGDEVNIVGNGFFSDKDHPR